MPANPDQTANSLTVSVIIPTKNRPVDLARTIETLVVQTVAPLELIIVDQSAEKSFNQPVPFPLRWIHEPALSGLSEARNAAFKQASGDIWLFLDDDVLLEPDFMEEILKPYDSNVTGVSGIITNYSLPPLRRRLWETVFQRGPFRDERQAIYRNAGRLGDAKPIRVRQFGGGLMSFRASAIRDQRFDPHLTGASPGEDIDFCAGLPKGSVLLIAPRARLIHNRSPESRDPTHWISVAAQVGSYMRERHWKRGLWNNLCYGWLSAGYAFMAGFSSLKKGSTAPWKAWRQGVRKGKQIALGSN
ncbi:MAG: glycosyltransferase family 2 protein [Candidatus Acidiferrales bacterium]